MPFFVLGSHPSLSVAEIAAVLGFKKDYSQCSKEILLLEDNEQSLEWLQDRLAGTIKIGDIIGEVKKINREEIADLIVSFLPIRKEKIFFGLSIYSCGAPINELVKEITKIGMTIKKRLKESDQAVRFVSSNTPALTSAAVTGEKLLENGGEFVFITTKDKILIGQTRTVQNFQAWSNRDYGRPARDTKSGMLPPKLARLMINLSEAKRNMTLLDPFCGSGTVLMEAALMGFTKIIGSDISEKAITDTQINLDWLKQNTDTEVSFTKLFNRSVETLNEEIKEKIETIITETYLGPPLSGRENPNQIQQITNELIERIGSGLASIKNLLKTKGVAIIAVPCFPGSQNQFLPTQKLVEKAGLKILSLLPQNLPKELQTTTPAGGLLYARKDQRVGREILKLVKK